MNFPLPFMPPFMDFDLSGVPEMIGGFALGPASAVLIIFIKLVLKLCFMGTSTMFTGEIQNFILSCAYVLPAVFIYRQHKTKKSAIWGMFTGTMICALIAVFSNICFIIPFYAKLYTGMSFESIIGMCTAVNPFITNAFSLAIFGIIPFNLIKNGVVSLLTIVLYKKISTIIKNYIRE